MTDTLIVFSEWDRINLYMCDWNKVYQYRACDNKMIDAGADKRVKRLIEHLGYMLGVDEWMGPSIPKLGDYIGVNQQSGDTIAEAPWKGLRVEGDCIKMLIPKIRLIRTGW